ncbi:MAG TPA: hypothetical protein VLM40_09800, partial [Gemmata sp.]|nr:hypothetical protein [Gemmata sp.]
VECRTPTPGKSATRIEKWKFDAIRSAIRAVVPSSGDGVLFSQLPELAKKKMDANELKRLGSLMWYVTVVKLELEVRGELRRVPDVSPQRLLRVR